MAPGEKEEEEEIQSTVSLLLFGFTMFAVKKVKSTHDDTWATRIYLQKKPPISKTKLSCRNKSVHKKGKKVTEVLPGIEPGLPEGY